MAIKKTGLRDGAERFVLINPHSRQVLTERDASEGAIRRFCLDHHVDAATVEACLERARELFAQKQQAPPVDDQATTRDADELLLELGLATEEPARP